MEWQPVETAPRDGRFFIVCNVDTKAKTMVKWCFRKRGFFTLGGYKAKFTHWQDFPEFPK